METTRESAGIEWTPRQREVLDLIARGRTNGEIGQELGISLAGAKWHVSEVLSKLGVASREEAAEYWRYRNRVSNRLGRAARALAGPLALKASLGAGGVVAVAVIGLAMTGSPWAATGGMDSAASQVTVATNGTRDFSVEEASARALELGNEWLDYARRSGPPGSSPVPALRGRPLRAEDMVLRERHFVTLATEVRFANDSGFPSATALPTDQWGFLFQLGPLADPVAPGELLEFTLAVSFEDGTGVRTSAGTASTQVAELPTAPETLRRAARGEDVSNMAATTVPEEWAAPRSFATYEIDLRRITISAYGEPADPCVRVDDTAVPDTFATFCPQHKFAGGGPVYGIVDLDGVTVGAAYPGVASVVAPDASGGEHQGTVYRLPPEYGDSMVAFAIAETSLGELTFRDANGIPVGSAAAGRPVPDPRDASVDADQVRSVTMPTAEGVGPGTTAQFSVPDPGARYAFIFQFAEDGGPVRVHAECNGGDVMLVEASAAEPLTPQERSIVARFPDSSTACRVIVEAEPGVGWRLYPK